MQTSWTQFWLRNHKPILYIPMNRRQQVLLGVQVYQYEDNIALVKVCSFGTQICSHLATFKCKKTAQAISLTPSMQTWFQSLHLYQLEPHRGRKSSGILSGEVLNSTGKHQIDFLFSSSVIFIFTIFSHFLCVSTC